MNGSTFIELSMVQKNLTLIRFKNILNLSEPPKGSDKFIIFVKLSLLNKCCARRKRIYYSNMTSVNCYDWC